MLKMYNLKKLGTKILWKIYGAVQKDGDWIKLPTTKFYKTYMSSSLKMHIHLKKDGLQFF